MKSRINRVVFLVFLVFILSACTPPESAEIKIVTPIEGYRIAEEYQEGKIAQVPLTVYYKGSEQKKWATVFLDGTTQITCELTSGQENYCGPINIYSLGDKRLKVEVYKSDGTPVASEVLFNWTPYMGLEKVAYWVSGIVGPNNVSTGFLIISGFAVITFSLIVLSMTKSPVGLFYTVWVSSVILIIAFMFMGTEVAAVAYRTLLGFVITLTLVGLIGYAISNKYSLGTGKRSKTLVLLPDGTQMGRITEGRTGVGPADNESDSDEVIERLIKAYQDNPSALGPGNYVSGSITELNKSLGEK